MKKLLLIFLGLSLLLSACNKEEHVSPEAPGSKSSALRFYGVKLPAQAERQGAAQTDRLWYNGMAIKVKFLDSKPALEAKIKAYAKEWEQYCNISFNFIESGDAHVRISFDRNEERYISWSYIGTDCKSVTDQNEPTMNFYELEWLDEEELRGDVLRMFGLVLGLELEHRNQNFIPNWVSEARAQSWWANDLEDVDWEVLKKYVYDALDADYAVQTDYDAESVMVWPFPKNVLRNGVTVKNHELSETDKAFVNQLYPKPSLGEPIITMEVSLDLMPAMRPAVLKFGFGSQTVVVDWGDGTVENVQLAFAGPVAVSHTYSSHQKYTVNVYGKQDAISYFNCNTCFLTQLDVSRCLTLQQLHCSYNFLSELNLRDNKLLESIRCEYNQLTDIDLYSNKMLASIFCGNNQLESLNVNNNTQLLELVCNNNRLSWINVSNNPKLLRFYFRANEVTEVNITQNPELVYFDCSENRLTELNVASNAKLNYLLCSSNQLTQLDLSNNPMIDQLYCELNQLTLLKVENCTILRDFICDNNQLTTLTLNSTHLEKVYCHNNPFITNQTVMEAIATSLPHKGIGTGYISVGNETAKSWILPICGYKRWIIS